MAAKYRMIADELIAEIRRGQRRVGERLPGTRALARTRGVQRNTVVAAYETLVAEGWAQARPQSGTFVAAADERRPDTPTHGLPSAPRFRVPRPALEAGMVPPQPKLRYSLAGGLPDLRQIPHELLARAYRRALRAEGPRLLGYLDPAGQPRLREALAEFLRHTRGIPARAEQVLVTRGAQQALFLVSQVLLRPGDDVAVERLGYPPAWAAMRAAGAKLYPVPVDGAGLDTERLGALDARTRLRAVYVTPHHQYPTMAVMGPARRAALLSLARRRRLVVIEDDYDHEVHFVGQPVRPLASEDVDGSVVYIGSLSKVLAPGLRLGYVVAPESVVQALAGYRRIVDHQGDHALERAIAELLEDGEVGRHVRRIRRLCAQRRAALVEALEVHLGDDLEFELPAGGLALWSRVQDGIDPVAWAQRAAARGVGVTPGQALDLLGRTQPYLRIGFAGLEPEEIEVAVAELAAARAA